MNKHVLFFLAIPAACLLILGIFLVPASAEYLNDTWLKEKSDKILSGESYAIPAGEDLRFKMKRLFPDSLGIDPDNLTIGIRPQYALPHTFYTQVDSVDSENRQVIRRNELRGLQVEHYYSIPFDEYAKKNLDLSLLTGWRNNTTRISGWVAGEKSGGITDLDFALPVGKRFEKIMGGKTRLDINGSQTITFSGKSEYDEGVVSSSITKNSSFPSLTMKQEPQFSIRGSVGERITVDIKQDPSESGSGGLGNNLEDNISIKYKGDTNDIIQSIEAGNTSLSLQGATFAGYSGTHKGLFGIRSEGRLGPLKFTAIASQEKSEASTKSFRGSAEETATEIKDYNYKTNTYFFLDFHYREVFASNRTSMDLIQYNPADSISMIEVYEDDGNLGNDNNAGAVSLPGTVEPMSMDGLTVKATAITGFFNRLIPNTDYYVDRNLGFILFRTKVPDSSTIGVYMRTKSGLEFGDLNYNPDDANSRIKLKLIKLKSQRPTDTDTWNLEWKNVYDLGQTNISADGLDIDIYQTTSEGTEKNTQNGTTLIRILGIDNSDEMGNNKPDNKVDLNRSYVDLIRGELIFPTLLPFDTEALAGVGVVLNPRVPKIYTTQNQQEKDEASKYYIKVKTANRQSSIKIDSASGIMEGTEKVTLNGKTLTRGSDYSINYLTGEITLLNKDALSATADIQVNYEEQNSFSAMQKSLLGLRTEYEFLGNSRIGGVFLFNNESTTDQRVKLGQEPSRNMLLDTDTSLNFEPMILTRMIDKLPLVIADQKSTVRFEGEVARSMPNMNTKGVVYVDDFEGSQNTPIGIGRTNWTLSSVPDARTTNGIALTRGRIQWYNPWDRIDSKDIWPNKETSTEDNTVHVMNLGYGRAKDKGDNQSFAGIMSPFYTTGLDMSHSRFIEVWARGSKGKLKIDIGSISEDVYPLSAPNSTLDTEDKVISGMGHGDGILTEDEDTGIDGLPDSQEPGYSASNTDPSGDNWNYKEKTDYSRINGTEGNRYDSDSSGIPDTEDINGNGVLDTDETYYEYTVAMDDPFDPYLVQDSVPAGNSGGWRLFRIPLWNNAKALIGGSGAPDSTLIESCRLWITGTDSTLIQIASMEVLESNWLEDGIYNTSNEDVSKTSIDQVRITRANTDENREYTSPPGVAGEIDRNTKVRKMEQSLVIEAEDISPGNAAFIYRNFGDKMDFTDYTSLKMFIHGPEDFPDATAGKSDVELVLRFGLDRANYYEYRVPVYRGWATENNVEAVFATCTQVKLKALADSSGTPADTVGTAIYTIKGEPNLQNIKIISIGIRNRSDLSKLTAQVWLDEMRMDNLRDMTGTAVRANITTDLAGLFNISGKITHKTADFHDMNSKKGSGSDDTEWNSTVTANLDRFTPKRWNLSLPVSVTNGEKKSLPRLKSGSDIILNDTQKEEYSSGSSDRKYSVSYRKNSDTSQKGVKKFLLNWGLEKWNAQYSWAKDASHSPLSGSNSDLQSEAKFTYNVNPTAKSVKPFAFAKGSPLGKKLSELAFNYTPNQLSYDMTYQDKNTVNTTAEGLADTTLTRGTTENINFGYDPVASLIRYRYTQSKNRDLYLKQETKYTESQNVSLTGPKFLYFTDTYEYQVNYTEDNNSRYSSSTIGRKVSTSKKFSINATMEWGKIFEDFSGKPKMAKEADPDSPQPKRDVKNMKLPEKKGDKSKDSDKIKEPDKSKEPEKSKEPDKSKEPEQKTAETSSGKSKAAKEAESESPQPKKNTKLTEKKGEKSKEPIKTKESDESKETEKKPATESLRTKMFLAISKSLSPITFRYDKNDQAAVAGVNTRPDFFTRFGQGGDIQSTDASETSVRQYNSTTASDNVSLDTDIKLPLDMGVKASANSSSSDRASSSSTTKSEQSKLPDVTFRWDNLDKKIPFLNKIDGAIKNLSLNSHYTVDCTKEWTNGSVDPTSDRSKESFSPLISVNGLLLGGLQTSLSFTRSTDTAKTQSGDVFTTDISDQNSTDASFRYSVNPNLGILRKLKLQSKIDLDMRFSASQTQQARRIADKPSSIVSKNSSWTVSPQATYQFSQKFTGSAMVRVENSKDMTNKVHKVREVSISGKMIF